MTEEECVKLWMQSVREKQLGAINNTGPGHFKFSCKNSKINTTFAVQFIKGDTKGQSDGKFNDNLFAWVISLKFDKRCQAGMIYPRCGGSHQGREDVRGIFSYSSGHYRLGC